MQSFKTWLESRDDPYLNPLYYDMSTQQGRAEYDKDKLELKQQMAQWREKREISREPHQEPFVLKCWRGCNSESLERMATHKGSNFIVLDASQSRSKAIWFSHQFQSGGKDYADDHGEVIISYPLKCKSYYDIVKYSDGETRREPSKEMSEKVQVYTECPFGIFGNMVLALPNGWTFSEHGEKHVICTTSVVIPDNMIVRNAA